MISERLGAALIVMTGRLMLEHDEANPTFFQTLAAFSAGATPAIVDYGNGAAFRFQLRVDTNLEPARVRRMAVPDQLLEGLNRSLARAIAPPGADDQR